MKRYSLITFAFASLLSVIAFAGTPIRYLWNNSTGFTSAAHCQVQNNAQSNFYVSQVPNEGLNSSVKLKGAGFFSPALLDRSIVASRTAPGLAAKALVKVLGVPENARHKGFNIAKVAEEGNIDATNLQEIGNYIIEVLNVPTVLTTAKQPLNAHKTFWQTSVDENEHYVVLSCQEGALNITYLAFDVYNKSSISPSAQVGLRVDQVSIFTSINVYTPDEANQLLSPTGEKLDAADSDKNSKTTSTTGSTSQKGGSTVTSGATTGPSPATPAGTTGTTNNSGGTSAVPTITGKLEYIICTEEDSVDVLDPELKKTLFEGDQFEVIIPAQSWNDKQNASYIEVQFPSRKSAPISGWVSKSMVKLKSECLELSSSEDKPENDNNLDMSGIILNSKDCCKFPTIKRSTQSYAAGKLQFRARRRGGRRLHAGCDLYRRHGETAVSVASGVVIRGLYYFYQGVFALEIKHPNFVARYGEILGRQAPGVSKGRVVKGGQEIGKVGTVSSRCCAPMLHFELYKGTTSGALTRYRRPPYDRRSDLMNPTDNLRKWEKAQFGSSY
jgi:murein DD-endopeptidase MepM/ murein hydrolase activator NlpD